MTMKSSLGRAWLAAGSTLVLLACSSSGQDGAGGPVVVPFMPPSTPPAMPVAGMGAPPPVGTAVPPAVPSVPPAVPSVPPAVPPANDMMDPTMGDMMDEPMMGAGDCCPDGDCLCHGPAPTGLTSADGPYNVDSYDLAGAGCVYYPTDAEPPFAAVTVSDGFGGTGGCGLSQTNNWGPLYASWGIVAMIIDTGSGDQPNVRGTKLGSGVDAFMEENDNSSSPLYQQLAGRYGTSGFSMGGGGTSYASQADPSLLSSVAIMPWGPVRSGVTVPTLVICGSSDGIAACGSHGTPLYNGIAETVPKMRVTVSSGHSGQPSAGSGRSGEMGLAFQKVFLEGDERWRPFLVGATNDATNIQ